jgi:hypothetical protein
MHRIDEWRGAPVGDGLEMQRVNDFWFYRLGYTIHPLTEVEEGGPFSTLYLQFKLAVDWLTAFSKRDDVFRFNVSIGPANELREYLAALTNALYDPARSLTASEAYRVSSLATTFETVTAAEVSTFNTYYVVSKMAYDTRALVEEGESLLPLDVQTIVPPETIEDLREAARCMAFEVNTAAGFHTIRATEAVIRAYYREVVGSLPKPKDRNWGAYIKILRGMGADPRVVGFLDHIRDAYRNPITHPEQRLTSTEAQVLLSLCVSAIIQMAGAIRALSSLANGAAAGVGSIGDMMLAVTPPVP